jgi:hypothetical protein
MADLRTAVKSRAKAQLVISAAGRTIVTTTSLSTTSCSIDLITISDSPSSVQALDARIVSNEELRKGTVAAPAATTDNRLFALRPGVCRVRNILAHIILGDVFGAVKKLSVIISTPLRLYTKKDSP